jgi:FAD/FMN-containing dehydrogenase
MSPVLESWGRFPKADQQATPIYWRHESLPVSASSLLPYGLGRSYGDSCLNDGNVVLTTRALDKLIDFDPQSGELTCEAGVSLGEILDYCVPQGWFLPVTPGTKFVTVGGAIANDVHGKNHHIAGSFGHYVKRLELLRSSNERLVCDSDHHTDLYHATIGGLGLTGLITWATIRLTRVPGRSVQCEAIKFGALDEFFTLSAESASNYEYIAAWVDSSASGSRLGRGIFLRGNHCAQQPDDASGKPSGSHRLPLDFPQTLLNRWTVRAFNFAYYHKQLLRTRAFRCDYEKLLYPLDSLLEWNRLYGKSGFLQYQCLVPEGSQQESIRAILREISQTGIGSWLAVLKVMGNRPSLGLLSFPGPGVTLAIDFPNRGRAVFSLLDRLDALVEQAGGRVYPAKDARMSARSFRTFYPQLEQFRECVDPKFSSSFWRRVGQPV